MIEFFVIWNAVLTAVNLITVFALRERVVRMEQPKVQTQAVMTPFVVPPGYTEQGLKGVQGPPAQGILMNETEDTVVGTYAGPKSWT